MKKLLLADDEEYVRLLVHATLEGPEYTILEARDGQEALRIARRELPQLILLDIKMPGLDGYQVCQVLKSDPRTAGIVVVMLSGLTSAEDRQRGKAAGADEYLTKPFSPIQLIQLTDRYLSDQPGEPRGKQGNVP